MGFFFNDDDTTRDLVTDGLFLAGMVAVGWLFRARLAKRLIKDDALGKVVTPEEIEAALRSLDQLNDNQFKLPYRPGPVRLAGDVVDADDPWSMANINEVIVGGIVPKESIIHEGRPEGIEIVCVFEACQASYVTNKATTNLVTFTEDVQFTYSVNKCPFCQGEAITANELRLRDSFEVYQYDTVVAGAHVPPFDRDILLRNGAQPDRKLASELQKAIWSKAMVRHLEELVGDIHDPRDLDPDSQTAS